MRNRSLLKVFIFMLLLPWGPAKAEKPNFQEMVCDLSYFHANVDGVGFRRNFKFVGKKSVVQGQTFIQIQESIKIRSTDVYFVATYIDSQDGSQPYHFIGIGDNTRNSASYGDDGYGGETFSLRTTGEKLDPYIESITVDCRVE